MSNNVISRPTRWVVLREGQPIFAEAAIEVSIEDEAAGEFVVLEQEIDGKVGKIAIDPPEWPALRRLINQAFRDVSRKNQKTNT